KALVISILAAAASLAAIGATREGARGAGRATVLTGTVEARELAIACEVAGRLVTAAVEEGQRVKKGDLLFAVDDAELRLKVRALGARQATALAELAALRAGPRREPIHSQRSRMREAEVASLEAGREVARARALTAAGAAPPADLDRAQVGYDAAAQRLAT